MANVVMANIVMAYVVMAYIVMAYIASSFRSAKLGACCVDMSAGMGIDMSVYRHVHACERVQTCE